VFTAAPQTDHRREDLKVLLDTLFQAARPRPAAWVRQTGELPPDFDAPPFAGQPPDPLIRQEERRAVRITTVEEWNQHKPWLREQVERYFSGRMPPKPDLRATVKSARREDKTTVRDVLTNHGRNRPWLYTLQ
jgi:hypothetical protein